MLGNSITGLKRKRDEIEDNKEDACRKKRRKGSSLSRLNLAIISRFEATAVRGFPNPVGGFRPIIGIRTNGRWYFTIHAIPPPRLPDGSFNPAAAARDVPRFVRRVQENINEPWIIAGDFNIEPNNQNPHPQNAQEAQAHNLTRRFNEANPRVENAWISPPDRPTHSTNNPIKRLDYIVASENINIQGQVDQSPRREGRLPRLDEIGDDIRSLLEALNPNTPDAGQAMSDHLPVTYSFQANNSFLPGDTLLTWNMQGANWARAWDATWFYVIDRFRNNAGGQYINIACLQEAGNAAGMGVGENSFIRWYAHYDFQGNTLASIEDGNNYDQVPTALDDNGRVITKSRWNFESRRRQLPPLWIYSYSIPAVLSL